MTDFTDSIAEGPTMTSGLTLPTKGSLSVSSSSLEWQATDTVGFWVKPLYENAIPRQRTCLMKIDAGASAGLHDHQELEQILVLSGDFSDQDRTYVSGDFVIRAPLTMHTASSEQGCTVLLIYNSA